MTGTVKALMYLGILLVGALVVFQVIPAVLGAGFLPTDVAYGYNHPVVGTDHLLAMIAVGLLSVQMVPNSGPNAGKRTSVWLVPLCFVIVLALGGVLGMLNLDIGSVINVGFGWLFNLLAIEARPVEVVIVISMVILGSMIISQARFPLWVGLLAVAFFALYHGHAHGQEMGDKGAVWFFAGFMLASAVIHILGVVIGELGQFFANPKHARALAGAVLTGAGAYIMFLAFGWA